MIRSGVLDEVPHTPVEHFRLLFYSAILRLRDRLERLGAADEALERFPFLGIYLGEFEGGCLDGVPSSEATARWDDAIRDWEQCSPHALPLHDLQAAAGLGQRAITLLFTAGLVEEDARFGPLFSALQPYHEDHRPTLGLLTSWFGGPEEGQATRLALHALMESSLLEAVNPDAPRTEWALQPCPVLWDALRGDARREVAPWARYEAPGQLPEPKDLILADPLAARVAALPGLIREGAVRTVLVRGPESSGKRALLRAVARACGRGYLELSGLAGPADERWRAVGPLATLLRAMPAVALTPGPGETIQVPGIPALDAPLGITLPSHGGAVGPGVERAFLLTVAIPDVPLRARHWQAALGHDGIEDLASLAESCRMTGGAIRRVAKMASAEAALEHRRRVTSRDVARARQSLQAELLDTLAVRVPAGGSWADLVVGAETHRELRLLETRCRCRERLPDALPDIFGSQLGVGVRALFTGPSGTGKSLAARLLAAGLGKDLYRLDLSAVVNKYLGETEKNLDRALSRAETLDVVLLIDEGDALLAQRTDVGTSNDRYANLETNFLLQRLETFGGILVVTTNAEQQIDHAFERRLDAIITFTAPGAMERWAIWALHLPAGHRVDDELLQDVAVRCTLTGGQIRNAVLHACLLALSGSEVLHSGHVEMAVRREYQKTGAVCPLRQREPARA